MALPSHSPAPAQVASGRMLLILASATLIVCLLCSRSIAGLRPQQQQQDQHKQPPVYVIHDEHRLKSSSSEPKSWNNQRLTLSRSSAGSSSQQQQQQRQQAEKQQVSSSPRSAKQLWAAGGDEPVPYYHSYKYMGLGIGEGSWADKYYQPLQRNHLNELPHLAAPPPEAIGDHQHAAMMAASKTSASRTASSTKVGSARKSPSAARKHSGHHQPPVALSPAAADFRLDSVGANTDRQNGTRNRVGGGARKNLVCYYGTWAVYRPDAGKYPVENIDPFLCTHIIYGFTGLSYDNLIKPLDPWNDLEDNYGKGAMKRFTNLKRINPDLKTLVAIGGWNEGSIKYSKMASEPEARAKFVQSVVDFLRRYNFDGLDLDWEYPGARGGHSYDKQNFVRLLRELKQAFQPHGYLLTAAVSAGKWFIDPAYDIAEVSRHLDLINLMAYDYHGGWESKTGMNAPLFHSAQHDRTADEQLLNVNWSVNYWLQQGAAREKIMLGVGSYGRSFTLDKASVNGINAPASQKGMAGPYTREPGSLGYNEICDSFQRQPQSWTIVRDPDYLAPYAYNDRQWVGYDDMESLALKAQFAKSMGLGGMMMWSIETDDFQGRCHNEKYPLLNTLKRVLEGGSGGGVGPVTPGRPAPVSPTTRRPLASTTRRPPTATPTQSTTPGREIEDDQPVRPQQGGSSTTTSTTRKPPTTARVVPGSTRKPTTTTGRPTRPSTTSTTTTTTTTAPTATGNNGGGEFVCRADGMFADPRNCRKFIRCVSQGGRGYSMYKFDCGPGTAFNEQQQYCDHIYNVPSCSSASAASAAARRSSVDSSSASNIIMTQPYQRQLFTSYLHHDRPHRHLQQSRILADPPLPLAPAPMLVFG